MNIGERNLTLRLTRTLRHETAQRRLPRTLGCLVTHLPTMKDQRDPLVTTLKRENRKLHMRLATLEAQNISLKSRIAALKKQMKKEASEPAEDLGERLRRARQRTSTAT